jgi:molecular chaperone GrpE
MTSRPEPEYDGADRARSGESQEPVRQVPMQEGTTGPVDSGPRPADPGPQGGPRTHGGPRTRGGPRTHGGGPGTPAPLGDGPADDELIDEIDEVPSNDQIAAATEGPEGSEGPEEPEGPAILEDVAALRAERDEYLAALQRLKADFENYRKRVVRQQEEQSARAAADLVVKLLPVLDTLDLAQAHLRAGPGEISGAEEGEALSQARAQLLDTLAKEGLERVDAAGVAFDPTVHDAVAHAPAEAVQDEGPGDGEGEPPKSSVVVEEVMRAGYRWRGQVLRPAMVRVRG